MMNGDVRQLVNLCLTNDPSAVDRLVDRFRDRVFRLCYRMLGQRQDAEDVVQETFVRAVRSLTSWDQTRDFEPWLLQIAANRCRTMLSRRSRRRAMPIGRGTLDLSQMRDFDRRLLAEEVDRVLKSMRVEWREAFRLFHESEFSYDEISQRLKCPIGTAKTWVHRARREIVRQLQAREVLS